MIRGQEDRLDVKTEPPTRGCLPHVLRLRPRSSSLFFRQSHSTRFDIISWNPFGPFQSPEFCLSVGNRMRSTRSANWEIRRPLPTREIPWNTRIKPLENEADLSAGRSSLSVGNQNPCLVSRRRLTSLRALIRPRGRKWGTPVLFRFPFVRAQELRILVSAMLLQMTFSTQEIMTIKGDPWGNGLSTKATFPALHHSITRRRKSRRDSLTSCPYIDI
jgi:hypothetical protein